MVLVVGAAVFEVGCCCCFEDEFLESGFEVGIAFETGVPTLLFGVEVPGTAGRFFVAAATEEETGVEKPEFCFRCCC